MKLKGILVPTKDALVPWSAWLLEMGVSSVTGWRWRQRKWVVPININGRLFICRDEIAKFNSRAARGEFAIKRQWLMNHPQNDLPEADETTIS